MPLLILPVILGAVFGAWFLSSAWGWFVTYRQVAKDEAAGVMVTTVPDSYPGWLMVVLVGLFGFVLVVFSLAGAARVAGLKGFVGDGLGTMERVVLGVVGPVLNLIRPLVEPIARLLMLAVK